MPGRTFMEFAYRTEQGDPRVKRIQATLLQLWHARVLVALALAAWVGALLLGGSSSAYAQSSFAGVLTYHNDNFRTGLNAQETILTPSVVSSNAFGRLFTDGVDGQIYAQPLYVPGVAIPNAGTHNVVYVATENDSVYAFDADDGGPPLWQTSFLSPGVTPIPASETGCTTQIAPIIGITATPVIDPQTGTIYVLAQTKENGTYVHRLHALDIATGAELPQSPVVVTASVSSPTGIVTFDPVAQNERSALLLNGSTVFLASASHCDFGDYHGWVIGYDKTSLNQVAAFNVTPNGSEGGIWMSGGGPAADQDGKVYVSTGNGTFDANVGGSDYGDSFVKLDPATLEPLDFFTPFNQSELGDEDLDLGSGGLLLLPDQPGPHPHLAISAGKEGTIYLVDRDNLGQFNASADQIVQELPGQITGLFDTPSYFNGRVYLIAPNDVPKAFTLVNGKFSLPTPASTGSVTFGYPGATPAVSANGESGSILWAIGRQPQSHTAILYAFDPKDLSVAFYNSEADSSRDSAGEFVKFTVPTVAAGKVFVPTASQLSVYGMLKSTAELDVTNLGKPSIRQGHAIDGGRFELKNLGTSPAVVASVTVAFSNPALFSIASISGKRGTTSRKTAKMVPSGSVTFTLKRPLTVRAGQTVKFKLKLTGAKGSDRSMSSQSVISIDAGSAVVGGLPAALGQIAPD